MVNWVKGEKAILMRNCLTELFGVKEPTGRKSKWLYGAKIRSCSLDLPTDKIMRAVVVATLLVSAWV